MVQSMSKKETSTIIYKNINSKENHNTNETQVTVQQAIQQENIGHTISEAGKIIKCLKFPRMYKRGFS